MNISLESDNNSLDDHLDIDSILQKNLPKKIYYSQNKNCKSTYAHYMKFIQNNKIKNINNIMNVNLFTVDRKLSSADQHLVVFQDELFEPNNKHSNFYVYNKLFNLIFEGKEIFIK